jgi:hypothetical protein
MIDKLGINVNWQYKISIETAWNIMVHSNWLSLNIDNKINKISKFLFLNTNLIPKIPYLAFLIMFHKFMVQSKNSHSSPSKFIINLKFLILFLTPRKKKINFIVSLVLIGFYDYLNKMKWSFFCVLNFLDLFCHNNIKHNI